MARILFIDPHGDLYPLQIGALGAYVKRHGHEARLLMLRNKVDFGQIRYAVEEFKPDFVGFTCYEMSIPLVRPIIQGIKDRWPNIVTVIGGYYPTLCPDQARFSSGADVVVRGEGEGALLDILNGDTEMQFDPRPLIPDITALPWVDRELEPRGYQWHIDQDNGTLKAMASRGCPFHCTNCSNKFFKELYPNPQIYTRMRTPEDMVSELVMCKEKYNFRMVGFHDDNLTLNEEWLGKFSEMYRKWIGKPFYCQARVETAKDRILDLLRDAGCEIILYGVESGSEDFRAKVLNRRMSNAQILDAFKRTQARGIRAWSFTMVGLPYETRRLAAKTVALNWKAKADFVSAAVYYPLRGTSLGDDCYAKGWVDAYEAALVTSYANRSVLRHPVFFRWEIRIWKLLNSLAAVRSPLFWKLLRERVSNILGMKRSS